MKTVMFESFGRWCSGRVVTGDSSDYLVYSRNPYGTHNLVVVDRNRMEAFRHGNNASLGYAWNWIGKKSYSKAMRFLMEHGVEMVDW